MPSSSTPNRSRTKKKSRNPPYIRMVFEAITKTRHAGKGVSRAKIASYIKSNWDNIAEGTQFNSFLRRAIKNGMERGVLEEGQTNQRFKITDLGRKERKETNHNIKYDEEEERIKAKKLKAKLAREKRKEKKKAASKKKKPASKRRNVKKKKAVRKR
eukprot:299460_1